MNIERALAIPGWMSEVELSYLASLAEKFMSIVEIGSWRGRSARAFADNLKACGTLICVDTWADNAYGAVFPGDAPDLCQRPDWLWNEFRNNLEDQIGITVFPARMTSMEGATHFAKHKFNCVFIDAGHHYEDVRADILFWRQLLKEGYVLCGHDYNPVCHPEVIQAVKEFVPKFRVVDTIWTTEEV